MLAEHEAVPPLRPGDVFLLQEPSRGWRAVLLVVCTLQVDETDTDLYVMNCVDGHVARTTSDQLERKLRSGHRLSHRTSPKETLP